jgi:hypothetical protein
MNVAATKEMSVSQVAALAKNRKGGIGVGAQYIRDEIARGRLKARLEDKPLAGKPYWVITEEDFLAWEQARHTGE